MLLTLVLFVFHSVDFANLTVAPAAQTAPFFLFMVAVLHAAVVSVLISGARWQGATLAVTVFLFFFGVGIVLPALDAVLGHDRSTVVPLWATLLNGFIVAGVIALVGVRAFDKWRAEDGSPETGLPARSLMGNLPKLAGKVGLLALLWPLISSLFQVVLGGGTFLATGDVLLYQAARGLLWVLLTVPVVHALRGERSQIALLVGLFYALLLGAPLLLPGDASEVLSSAEQTALLIQIVGSATLYGWLVGWVMGEGQ